jgi:hypothetical protein
MRGRGVNQQVATSITQSAAWRAVAWGVLGTLGPALADLSTSNWFGAGDLRGLLFFSLPFIVVLAFSGVVLARRLSQRPLWAGLIVGGIAGTVLGFLWTFANALLLGAWFGAWSFPVLLCWMTGGALSLASAATTRATPDWGGLTLESCAYVLVAVAALYVYRPAVTYLSRDQHLTLVYGRISPQDSGLAIDDSRDLLNADEKSLLASAGITGSIELLGGHAANATERPRARILILLRRPVDRVYRLPEPDATAVLYIQEDTGFRRFPPDAKVLSDRAVELYPAGAQRKETRYWIELAGGARSGGGIEW